VEQKSLPFSIREYHSGQSDFHRGALLLFSGKDPARPSLRPSQNCATGQSRHCGDFGVHSVAPSSIMAWFQSPG